MLHIVILYIQNSWAKVIIMNKTKFKTIAKKGCSTTQCPLITHSQCTLGLFFLSVSHASSTIVCDSYCK